MNFMGSAKAVGDLPSFGPCPVNESSDPALRAGKLAGGSELEVSSSPEEFVSFMKAETAKWRRLIQITGVKTD